MKTLGTNTEKTQNITNPKVTDYINTFYHPLNDELNELRKKAEDEFIPIILKEAETYLSYELLRKKPKRILEIGTAIGYSALFFCTLIPECNVTSLERMPSMIVEAKKNIKKFEMQDRITILEGDAVGLLNDKNVDFKDENDKFDLLFVDAAKSKYIEFVEGAIPHLSKDAVIICDNILMGARVASDEYDSKHKHRTNIRHLREFNEFINNRERFNTAVLPIGDGITVTTLK